MCSNSHPLSRWCHPTISSSVAPFSSCLQSFPASESFSMSQLFPLSGQSIRASASAINIELNIPMNTQGWLPLGLTGLISLQSKGLTRVFCSTMVWKHEFFGVQPSLWSNSHSYKCLLENHSFDSMKLCCQSDVSAFLMHYLGLSQLSFQGESIFQFHGSSHYLQWFWSPWK